MRLVCLGRTSTPAGWEWGSRERLHLGFPEESCSQGEVQAMSWASQKDSPRSSCTLPPTRAIALMKEDAHGRSLPCTGLSESGR